MQAGVCTGLVCDAHTSRYLRTYICMYMGIVAITKGIKSHASAYTVSLTRTRCQVGSDRGLLDEENRAQGFFDTGLFVNY